MKNQQTDTAVYKDWADAGDELEVIGQQLDSVRKVLDNSPLDSWARDYWGQVYDRMLRKWQQTILLMDIGLKQINPHQEACIDYSWFEQASELRSGIDFSVPGFSDWANSANISNGLTHSWEKGIEQMIQKARQGLA